MHGRVICKVRISDNLPGFVHGVCEALVSAETSETMHSAFRTPKEGLHHTAVEHRIADNKVRIIKSVRIVVIGARQRPKILHTARGSPKKGGRHIIRSQANSGHVSPDRKSVVYGKRVD